MPVLFLMHADYQTSTLLQMITQALYELAEKPELLTPLREEIQANISADPPGWTSTALAQMWMLDSILRETLRHHGMALRKPAYPPRASACTVYTHR